MICFSSCPYYSTFYFHMLETAATAGFPEVNYSPERRNEGGLVLGQQEVFSSILQDFPLVLSAG